MRNYRTIVFIVLALFFMLFPDSVYAGKTKRKRTPKSETSSTKSAPSKSTKKKGKSKKGAGMSIAEADSLLAAGDTASVADNYYKILEQSESVEDTSTKRLILVSLDYYVNHAGPEKVLKVVEKIPEIDSTLAPNAEYLKIKSYDILGMKGYAFMLAREMEHNYAGTDWEKKAGSLANGLEGQLKTIQLSTKPQVADTSKASK